MPSYLPLHEWSCLKTELIWIYDRPVDPRHQQWKGQDQAEGSQGYRAWLIRRGSVSIQTKSRTYTAGAGKWIIPVKRAAAVSFSKNAHILSINFLCQWPSGENLLTGREGLSFRTESYPALESIAKRLHLDLQKRFPEKGAQEHVYNRKSSGYDDFLTFHADFLRWLAVWFQIQMENGARLTRLSSGDDRPFQAARYLTLAPLDGGFPEAQLQRETGLGLMRLNQLFISEFGITTRKYWDQRRLEFAKQCLETSRMPMKEIACRLGFRSDSHFVIWFRRLTSHRPGDYRNNYLATSLP